MKIYSKYVSVKNVLDTLIFEGQVLTETFDVYFSKLLLNKVSLNFNITLSIDYTDQLINLKEYFFSKELYVCLQ